jgi:pimeloyl-ACP methyl ester carboxylesterase
MTSTPPISPPTITTSPTSHFQGQVASIDKPTLLVAAANSPEAFRQVTDVMAASIPNSRKLLVEGGHLISPADPAVLSFLQSRIASD